MNVEPESLIFPYVIIEAVSLFRSISDFVRESALSEYAKKCVWRVRN